jgi:cobalamin biosynthesis protein CobD/CbiB
MTERKPVKTPHHLAKALHPSPSVLREAMGEVDGFNAKFAVLITRLVGTMWCAYLFTALALIGLPAALRPSGEGIIAWIAQTFLQLVLLSVIMVGQNVQSLAADARAENTFKDAETILDRLDIHTQGGLKAILDRLDQLAP